MARFSKAAGLLAAAVLGTGLVLVGAPAAQAATCSGASCMNKDPQATGCNTGTKTLTTRSARGYYNGQLTSTITTELRWTAACGHVAWLRTNSLPNGGPMPSFKVESCNTRCTTHYVIEAPWGTSTTWPHCTKGSSGICVGPYWTNMVPTGGMDVRICGADVKQTGSSLVRGPWYCSDWY